MNDSFFGIELETVYHQRKLHFFKLNPVEFYNSLEKALLDNELDIGDTIQIEYESSVELFQFLDEIQIIKQFLEEYDLEKKHRSIHEYITHNRSQIGTPRLFQLFGAWIFWIALYPQSILNKPPLLFSLDETIQLAKSVLDDRFIEVFTAYQPILPWRSHLSNTNSIYDIIKYQPNVLARAICSQDCENLSLLVANGLNVSSILDYDDPRFQSPVQIAFACRNIEMYQLLVLNECKPLSSTQIGVVLPEVKKDFKMSLMLLKTANMLNERFVSYAVDYKSDSAHNLFQDSFLVNMYKSSASRDEIFEIYDLLLSSGFSLSMIDQVCEHQFTQFTYCICQSCIKPFIVEFLLQKFIHEKGHDVDSNEMQSALTDTLAYLVHYYENLTESVVRSSPLAYLTTNEILIILRTLFPLVNRKCKVFKQSQFSIQHHLVYNMSVSSDRASATGSSLFDTLEFKLVDFLLNYKIFETVKEMDSLFASVVFSFNHELMFLFTVYILENNFLSGQLALSWFENVAEKTYFGAEFKVFIRRCIIPMCRFYICRPRMLRFIAREQIRSSLPSISNRNVKLLGFLPPNVELYLKQTVRIERGHEAMRFFFLE